MDEAGRNKKIVVIGAGAVGSTTAYTLFLRGRAEELVLIDANHEKALGDALDMNHGLPFVGGTRIWAGTYADCAGADIIVIAAGAAQKPGETRIDLLHKNTAIFADILDQVTKVNDQAILLVATNPVDILTYYTWRRTGWPVRRVIGSGTLLDSARLRYLIGEQLKIDPRSVHAHIIGEHGDSELPVWSLANVAGTKLTLEPEQKQALFEQARDAAYRIINAKGATYYAIALAIDRICAAILHDESAVLTVSTLLSDYHGISDVYLGIPSIVDRTGVRDTLPLPLNEEEKAGLVASADKLKALIATIGL